MGDKLYNIVRALLAYLVCCHQVLSFNVAKSGETYVQAGSQTTLSCRWTPPAGISPLRVNWRQGSAVIATATTPYFAPRYPQASLRGRVALGTLTSTSTSTSITLSGLQCPNDIAEYSCDITADALQDDSGTASFNVNLFDFLGYNIAISSSPSQLQAGQHASLTCTASNIGRPPGIMKWYKADQEITTGFTQQTSINSDGCTFNGVSGLSILPTSQDDGVMYTCVVEPNSPAIGDSTKQGRYTLDVQYPVRQGPTVTSSTGTWTVEQGTTFTLNCQASGNPSPSYVWTSPDNTNSTGSQLVLTLSATGTYVYTCFATNSLTTTPFSTGVTVIVQEQSSTLSTTTTSTTTSTTPVHVAVTSTTPGHVAIATTKTEHVAVGAGKLKGGEVHYSPEDIGVIVGTVVAEVIILLGAAVVLFVLYRRGILHRFWKNRQPGDTVDVDVTESNNEYALLDIKEVKSKEDTYTELRGKMPSLYIPPGRIRLDEKIGKGRISEVWKGEAIIRQKARTVAVKRLNDQSSQKDELVSSFEKEIQSMKALPPHPYIVMFYGSSQQNGVALMVLEFMSNGNLKQLLKNSRGTGQYSNLHGLSNTLTSQQLMRFAYQVASGMTHVAKHKGLPKVVQVTMFSYKINIAIGNQTFFD
ncbi:cell adhesion molecule 1-like [Lingula anatina]|uniref:Cell adhesion molecule 1-like n=1 Tax=Lingula anatina TaxID=7574 RepID=A0A1S3JYI9_LINAN|nr:cell adhesion molecule 1-like [Lingula anatina]|eukprot:XP_013415485.1 cell adhesion molecule 1-like [Lingula anatina]